MTAEELLEVVINRIETLNPKLNAICPGRMGIAKASTGGCGMNCSMGILL
jgi:hypothetical protein